MASVSATAPASASDAATWCLPSGRVIAYGFSYRNEPQRPTILLSNSLGAQYAFWDPVVACLHAAGYRVLRYDHPGHGASGVPRDISSTTFSSLADDVYALLTSADVSTAFAGHHSPNPGTFTPLLHAWIGVSMGAALGIVFASKYPAVVRRMVICDTIACSPVNAGVPDLFGPRAAAARELGSMEKNIAETMDRWFGQDWMSANPDETARIRQLMSKTTVAGFETCVAALRSKTFDLGPLYSGLGACVERVLLVVGENDANLPQTMDEMRREIEKGMQGGHRKVDLRVIPNAGHVCFIDGKEDWLNAVLPFLGD
ncbi:Alpha/Beta hydrolase protein [Podospora didyma]|uniref:Alpha/Beta hydrolase protein n=1 Tax=Podospora didyma TaxID=330526 RepID=A0AAE0NUL1_9PEZI|nr:Alpha/Beta hydrolase protein [Podospora didyma]